MRPFFFFFFFFPIFALSLSPPLPFSLSFSPLIHGTCKNSSLSDPNVGYAFCANSLQAAPASECATLRGLGTISIKLIRDNATNTKCYAKRLLRNNKLDPFVRACLLDCLELYSDAIPRLTQAVKSYRSRRYDDANIEVSGAMDASSACEDGFKERRGVVSPLTKKNKDIFQLSAMALSIMNMQA